MGSECKGILKTIIEMEKFNPSVFFAECVKTDIVETHVMKTLRTLINYTVRRRDGKINAPDKVLARHDPEEKKRRLEEEAEEKAKKKGQGQGQKGQEGRDERCRSRGHARKHARSPRAL